ncbi:phage tail sheath family protein [Sphaerisporangium corydalis]|uniref:Phage tail sheath family protein n=1 Tax=Sphaerisporangium corydalis TaxID=1441875 RepID=A0ABV9E955_9ACTN|nr:phage tail sheath subtilisin-like domain-containing protein [Sphaerisporangium corydalis]
MTGLTPGVYPVNVLPAAPPNFLTGVPAFVGRAPTGPGTPRRLTLWPEFEAVFGGPAEGFLHDAVRGFFENDGVACYVVRLADTDPAAPSPDELERALAALEEVDDVDLVCAPDLAAAWRPGSAIDTVTGPQRALLRHCRDRGDRFAILDCLATDDPGIAAGQRDALNATDGAAGSYGALYHPWLRVGDRDGRPRHVPPCGHIAGVYSRGDRRVGVHKAPANEVVEGALDLRSDLTAEQAGELYARAVNCVRALPGRGIRVWGARTLSDDPAWRDVSARRVVANVHRWVERFMRGLVFEPNDIRLWVRIMRELTAYLDGLFQRGALKGRTAEEAFFVKCDSETNPGPVVDAGMVVTEIGVAPSAPAEYIVVRVIQGASGVTINAV